MEDDLRLPPVTPGGPPQQQRQSPQPMQSANYSPVSATSSTPGPSGAGLQPPAGLPSMSATSARTPPPRSSPGNSDRAAGDKMSLGSIMEKRPDTDIDRSMLGRLGRSDRKGQ